MEEKNIVSMDLSEISKSTMKILLQDRSTKRNIIWATPDYESVNSSYKPEAEITIDDITGFNACHIRPRVLKSIEAQAQRTKTKAEVFTPSWVIAQMVSYLEESWFDRKNTFAELQPDHTWIPTAGKIDMPDGKTWEDYIDSSRIEITCGEAPFIVSRYDASTGAVIPVEQRIGILDNKLRVVRENTHSEEEWLKWALRALKSVYGYEYQGDNLLIARVNVLMDFAEHMEAVWGRRPDRSEMLKAARIIAWNFWQMDGLKGTAPFSDVEVEPDFEQLSLFGEGEVETISVPVVCLVRDWLNNKISPFYDKDQCPEKSESKKKASGKSRGLTA